MNTKNPSVYLYLQDGKWFICREDKCQSFAVLNLLANRKTLIIAAIVAVAAIVLAFSPFRTSPPDTNIAAVALIEAESDNNNETKAPALNEENLLEEIKAQGIICEKHVMAQAKLESLHLTSHLCRRANNIFGMRYPGRRPTTAIGVYLQGKDKIIYGTREELRPYLTMATYAVYASWQDAVKDYKLWQDNAFKVEEKYLSFLNRIYAEDSSYVAVVRKMAKRIQD